MSRKANPRQLYSPLTAGAYTGVAPEARWIAASCASIRFMPAFFHPAVAAWFARPFPRPTPAQAQAWPAIEARQHVLIAAPTGSGKTLAAFLAAIDELVREGLAAGALPDETQIVYVSPLKALSNDIQQQSRGAAGRHPRGACARWACPMSKSAPVVRTGDTPQSRARRGCAAARRISWSRRRSRSTSCWARSPAARCWRPRAP